MIGTWLRNPGSSSVLASLLAIVLAAALLAGCKQGVNEVCQVDSDCEEGLVCNRVQGTCQEGSAGGVDAAPVDAATPATPDAAPEADATPEADAAPADAAAIDATSAADAAQVDSAV